jgi:hypothetical protein
LKVLTIYIKNNIIMRARNVLSETNDMRRLMGIPLLKEDTPAGFSLGFAKSGGLTIDEEDNHSMNEIEKAQKMAEERALKEKELKEKSNKGLMEDNLTEQEPEIGDDEEDVEDVGDGEDGLGEPADDEVVAEDVDSPRLTETNKMRRIMGLPLLKETHEKEKVVIGTGDTGEDDEAGAPESEEGEEKEDEYEDKTNIEETTEPEQVDEDSEGEETYHYGEDEGEDRDEEEHLEDEEKMAPEDRIGEIERHLDELKKDMGFDEDHEDRDEEGTDFTEGKTFKGKIGDKVVTLSEGGSFEEN